ncbi:hypothetical protein BT96DRAFT_912039, partial [Gymnopus androsaceus JB14]
MPPFLLSNRHYHCFSSLESTALVEIIRYLLWPSSTLSWLCGSRSETLHSFNRRGAEENPPYNPITITLVILFAIIFPFLFLYSIRSFIRRRRTRERRESASCQRNIQRLLAIHNSLTEPLPLYFPPGSRPPSYVEICIPDSSTAAPEKTKLEAPAPVHNRERSGVCFHTFGITARTFHSKPSS